MPKKDYSQIESLDNWIGWNYLTGVRKWSPDETAYALHLNLRRLTEWIGARSAVMNKLMKAHPKKVEAIIKELNKRFPREVKVKPKLPNIPIKRVIEMLEEKYTIPEMAAKLRFKPDKFRAWYNANLPDIKAQIKGRPRLMDVDPFYNR